MNEQYTRYRALLAEDCIRKESSMTYSIIKFENNEVIVYLGSLKYEEISNHIDSIIAYFKTSNCFGDFYLLENETR